MGILSWSTAFTERRTASQASRRALGLARDAPDLPGGHRPVERPDVDPGIALLAVQKGRVRHRLTAEDLDHLVAVDRALGLEMLPSLGSLVHAHIFDREGPDIEGAGASLRLFLAVNLLAASVLFCGGKAGVREVRGAGGGDGSSIGNPCQGSATCTGPAGAGGGAGTSALAVSPLRACAFLALGSSASPSPSPVSSSRPRSAAKIRSTNTCFSRPSAEIPTAKQTDFSVSRASRSRIFSKTPRFLLPATQFDALVGAPDRHALNWAVLQDLSDPNGPRRFAPVFDTARGLFGDHDDAKLRSVAEQGSKRIQAHIENYANKSKPVFGCQAREAGDKVNHFELIEYSVTQLREDLALPMRQVINSFSHADVHRMLVRRFRRVISSLRLDFISELLRFRSDRLKIVVQKRP